MTIKPAPLRGKNAIESAVFAVAFAEPIDAAALARVGSKLKEQLGEELPGEEHLQAVQMAFGMGGIVTNQAQLIAGAHRFLTGTDGQLRWSLRIDQSSIQVICFEYSNYDEVSEKSIRFILTAVSALEINAPVGEIVYHVVDKFLYPQYCEDADASRDTVFNAESEYLTPKSGKTGKYWHVFQGWFDNYSADILQSHILNQLNINSTPVLPSNSTGIFIDHRCSLRSIAVGKLFNLGDTTIGEEAQSSLRPIFDRLHRENTTIIRDLLNQDMLDSIGMGKTS